MTIVNLDGNAEAKVSNIHDDERRELREARERIAELEARQGVSDLVDALVSTVQDIAAWFADTDAADAKGGHGGHLLGEAMSITQAIDAEREGVMNTEGLDEAIFQAIGEVTALFMSNPLPGTEQVMPDQECERIGRDLAAKVSAGYRDRIAELENQLDQTVRELERESNLRLYIQRALIGTREGE